MFIMFTRRFYLKYFLCIIFTMPYVPQIFGAPTALKSSLYEKFIEFSNTSHCQIPSYVILPDIITPDEGNKWSFLSKPLQICQSPTAEKEDVPSLLCSEVFDVLVNVTCNNKSVQLPPIDVQMSSDVCGDFSLKKDLLINKTHYLGTKLVDPLICKVICREGVEDVCKFLLWIYEVQNEKNDALNKLKENDHKTVSEENHLEDDTGSLRQPNVDNAEQNFLPGVNLADKKMRNGFEDASNKKSQELDGINVQENKKPLNEMGSDIEAGHTIMKSNHTQPGISLQVKINESNSNLEVSGNHEESENKNPQDLKATNDTKIDKTIQIVPDESLNLKSVDKTVPAEAEDTKLKGADGGINKAEKKKKISHAKNLPHISILEPDLPANINNAIKTVAANASGTELSKKITDGNIKKDVPALPDITARIITQEKQDVNVSATPVSASENHVSLDADVKSNDIAKGKMESDLEPKAIPNEVAELPKLDSTSVSVSTMLEPSQKSSTDLFEKADEGIEAPSPDKDEDEYIIGSEDIEGDFEGSENDNPPDQPPPTSKELDSKVSESAKVNNVPINDDMTFGGFLPKNTNGQNTDDMQMISVNQGTFPEQEDSHFFFYFLSIILIVMAGYLIFHNKQKIIALIVEGRHEKRRRSHGVGYKKLETK